MLARFAHSLARGTVNDWIAIYSVFFSILAHSALVSPACFDVMIDGLKRNGADFDGSILLNEDRVTRQVPVHDSAITVPNRKEREKEKLKRT